jgi:hypothetical protein
MEILPTNCLWEELQMLQLYPQSCGKRCGNSWKLFPQACGQSCRCYNSTHRPVGRDVATLPTWKLPIGLGKRCGNCSHRPVGRVVDATTLPTGLWEEMWQLFPQACGQRCHNSTHRPVGRVVDATTLPTSLWEDLQLFPQWEEMWQLFPHACGMWQLWIPWMNSHI